MIDTSYSQSLSVGHAVYCDEFDQIAWTADGFCNCCGSTSHKAASK